MESYAKPRVLVSALCILAVIGLGCFVALSRPVGDPSMDLFFHLRVGQWTWEAKTLPLVDVFSYTMQGKPDECHSWLSQVLMYLVYRNAGWTGLRILFALVASAVLGLAVRFVYRATRNLGYACLVSLLILPMVDDMLLFRPRTFATLLFATFVWGILAELRPIDPKRLAVALFLTALWSNLHASVVLLPLVFFMYAATLFVDWFRAGRSASPSWLTLASPALIFLASCLNPRGPYLYLYALQLNRAAKQIGIGEWGQAPLGGRWIPLTHHFSLWLPLSVLSATVLVVYGFWFLDCMDWRTACGERLYRAGLTLMCLILYVTSRRHVFFLSYGIVAYAIVARERFPSAIRRVLAAQLRGGIRRDLVLTFCGLTILPCVSWNYRREVFPSLRQSMAFLKDTDLTANLYTNDMWADYVIFERFPKIKVAYNNRTLLFRDIYALETKSRNLLEVLKGISSTDLVLLPREDATGLPGKDWLLVFENNTATIWIRKGVKNAENLSKIQRYYRERRVPFDSRRGFDPVVTFRRAPGWILAAQEEPDFGPWIDSSIQLGMLREKLEYLKSLAARKRIRPSRLADRTDSPGAVRLMAPDG